MSVDGYKPNGLPLVLSEFGGIAFSERPLVNNQWGYTSCKTVKEFKDAYTKLIDTVMRFEILSGFCYTQLTDTFQEVNGLLYADRTPKFPLAEMGAAMNRPAATVEEVAIRDYPYSEPLGRA